MFNFGLPLLSLFFIFSITITTNGLIYNPTEIFFIDCGSSTSNNTISGRTWDSDVGSNFVPPNILTASISSESSYLDPSVDTIPYNTARIFKNSPFTYNFPVSDGPKFVRLYFYPATYSDLNADESFFSVTSNSYSLLTNFSASLTANFLSNSGIEYSKVSSFVKEFIINVKDSQFLNLTFTPSPNSFAFINGIEIVSMPEDLYYIANNLKSVGTHAGAVVYDYMALETIYRFNVGGGQISGTGDTGMYRNWDRDENYIISLIGNMPTTKIPITYTANTPNYTAPVLVYQTQRSMGDLSEHYNLTWTFPVDSGFYYMLRLHFCNIIQQYNFTGQTIFKIFINNQSAEDEADLFFWTQGIGYRPVFKDYGVFVGRGDGQPIKQDLWLALHPNDQSQVYRDGLLNGLEVFKLSMTGNLAGPNPEPRFRTPPSSSTPTVTRNKKKTPFALIAGIVVGGLVVLSILALVVLWRRRRVKHYATAASDKSSWGPTNSESKSTKSTHSTLPSDRCRRFSLTELKLATNEFNDDYVIGHGGFGKVYKGYMDNATTIVAIKRLNASSSQGTNEFHTEIGMLSKLRHVQLVSLIGYCQDEGEMILVYDYMAHGTLREHLYKMNNPHLSWKTRLQICIGAAKGLHYLHTGANRAIIHRDVKSTNILLDENWVAKVSDFGLSKLGPTDHQEQNHVSTVVKGSFGYVDPEYYRTQHLTDKSDVYSFGVVLLEVLCARPVMIPSLPKEQVSLAEWAKYCYRNKGTLDRIVDPTVRGEIAPECLKKFCEVAINCLKEQRSERPTMEEVVWGLEFALLLQEGSVKTISDVVPENQDLPLSVQGEPTTTDDEVFTGSSAIRNGASSISSTFEGFKSETVFSEMQKPTGR